MSDIKIEKNIPLPRKYTGEGRPKSPIRVALEAMEVGDSFEGTEANRKYVGAISCTYRLKGRKFTSRKTGDDKFRIWRIK